MTNIETDTIDNAIPRVVLITGAAHRIGRIIALDMARRGWAVAVHYNTSKDTAEALAGDITQAGGCAAIVPGDLGREDDVEKIVGRAADALGPVGCLINNASVFENDLPETTTRESWDRHMEANLRAPFVLIQKFMDQLGEGKKGVVVNIIDQRVWSLTPYFTSYTLSKAGLWTLTQTLAQALAPRIRVNAIGPGPTLPSVRQAESDFERQWKSMPLARPVSPDEIAAAVQFILTADSMTGQMVALDSGQHLGWAPGAGLGPEE